MTPQMIVLIVQVLLTYGPAAAREIAKLFRKDPATISLADWEAVFAMAETPLGVTPDLALIARLQALYGQPSTPPAASGVLDLGKIETAPLPNPPDAAAQVLPGTVILTKFREKTAIGPLLCDQTGNCWTFTAMASVRRTPLDGGNELWLMPDGKTFWVAQSIVAQL